MTYWKPGPYSLLATLNTNKELGGYPNNVPVNSTFTLYAYIENHENKIGFYEVNVYILNASIDVNSTFYLHKKPYLKIYSIINNNGNSTIPFNVTFEKSGQYKIALLLFLYNGTDFQYTNLYNQLYVNATVG
ncbi:hypothetical protein [Caldisphaera lagunensis]|nr:hypothetical protein [Caldisphaera lagunensis]